METILYVATAALAIAWSVYAYIVWSEKERRAEYVAGRFFLIVGPSGYFLLLILTGWQQAPALRLDLIGLLVYDAFIAVCWLVLLLSLALRPADPRRTFVGVMAGYHTLSLLLVLVLLLLRLFPALLIPVSSWISQSLRIDFFRFTWIALNPETGRQDFVSLANKVLIALLSYIPISLILSLIHI